MTMRIRARPPRHAAGLVGHGGVRRTVAALSCGCLLAGGLAACGESSDSSAKDAADGGGTKTATTSGAAAPKGPPMTIVAIGPVDNPTFSYPEINAGAQAAAKEINGKGGIRGHAVRVVFCDDKFDANQTAACARKAVSLKASAVVGASQTSGLIYKVIAPAGIPYVGSAGAPADLTPKNAYNLTSSLGDQIAAQSTVLAQAGSKKQAILAYNIPAAQEIVPVIKQAIARSGATMVKQVNAPVTATDLSPYLATIKQSGADGVISLFTPASMVRVLQAARQQNFQGKFTANGLIANPSQAKQWASLGYDVYLPAPFPPPGSDFPGMKAFTAAMQAVSDVKGSDTLSGYAEQTYFAVGAIKSLLPGASGSVTAATLTKALESSPGVDIGGMWTYKPAASGPPTEPRVPNGLVWNNVARDGKIELAKPESIKVH